MKEKIGDILHFTIGVTAIVRTKHNPVWTKCSNELMRKKMKEHNLKFKYLELDDLKLIFHWFKVPEINQWYAQGKEWSLADIEAEYKPRLTDKEVVPSFIVNLDS